MGLGDNAEVRNASSSYLPNIRPDQTLTPTFVGKIISGVDASTPRFGNGYQLANYSTGSVIRIPTPYKAGSPTTNFYVNAYISSQNRAEAIVSVGTVNRVVPKVGNKFIDQLEADGLPPRILLQQSGYIVIQATYTPNKPFPDAAEIRFLTTLPSISSEQNVSVYPLAKITGTVATRDAPAGVVASQYHLQGNLAVNRFKIGQSAFFWQWYTV